MLATAFDSPASLRESRGRRARLRVVVVRHVELFVLAILHIMQSHSQPALQLGSFAIRKAFRHV